MKVKEIHDILLNIVERLERKVKEAKNTGEMVEYAEGQLYEATYLLGRIEEIIYKD